MRDVLLTVFPVTCTGSGPTLRVACMFDWEDGREGHGRARTRGRRGLSSRDHPRAARGSPAHSRVLLRAQSWFAESSTPTSVGSPGVIQASAVWGFLETYQSTRPKTSLGQARPEESPPWFELFSFSFLTRNYNVVRIPVRVSLSLLL